MTSRDECRARDESDPLADRRELFDLQPGMIYLDGNSLGPPTKAVAEAMKEAMTDWRERLIHSWWESKWVDLPRLVGERLEPIVGAEPSSIVCSDSTTVNLFKAVASMCQLSPGDILTDQGNFPSDLYVLRSLAQLLERRIRVVASESVMESIDEDVGVMALTHVDFRSGRLHRMKAMSERAHQVGAKVVWDLSHSAGVIPIDLADCGVDAAVGCAYKYLNGGPGAPAYIYVSPQLLPGVGNPINGWFSHLAPFDFSVEYSPAAGIDRMRAGTPDILSMVAFAEALRAYQGVSIPQVREKSMALTTLFIDLIDREVGCEVLTPRGPEDRGSQVSLRVPQAEHLMLTLQDQGIVGDFRPPDVARFGFAPLYIGYEEVWLAAMAIKQVLH